MERLLDWKQWPSHHWQIWVPGLTLTTLLCVLICAGCSAFKTKQGSLDEEVRRSETLNRSTPSAKREKKAPTDDTKSSVSKVRLDGSLSLGDTDQLAYTPEAFATILTQCYSNQRLATAVTMLREFPDIAARVLLENHAQQLSLNQRVEMCKQYTQLWGTDASAFESLANSYQSGTITSVLNQHRDFLRHLESNQPDQALKLRLSRQLADESILQAESLRLEGMAYLMLEDHQSAAAKLSESVSILESCQPIEADRTRLLQGEAYRRSGDSNAWEEAWLKSVLRHSELLESRRLADPQFWKQAAFLRPVSTPWPAKAIQRLRKFTREFGLEFEAEQQAEAIVWSTIGMNSLKRHESQNAILSFKKAESLVSNRFLRKELQLKQAMAMIEGGQPGPASAILFRISSEPGMIADRAKAILATMKLQNGSLAQGMSLLQSAIKTSASWPVDERLRAQADYGLAYLMRGKERQGVSLLDQLYQEFRRRGDYDQATQCLFNLATYFEKTDKPGEHRAVMTRLKELESEGL